MTPRDPKNYRADLGQRAPTEAPFTWQTLDRRIAITALRLGVIAICCSPVVEDLPVVARLGKWLGLGIGEDAKAVADKALCEAEALLVAVGEIPKEGT